MNDLNLYIEKGLDTVINSLCKRGEYESSNTEKKLSGLILGITELSISVTEHELGSLELLQKYIDKGLNDILNSLTNRDRCMLSSMEESLFTFVLNIQTIVDAMVDNNIE